MIIHRIADFEYIRSSEVPQDEQADLEKFMRGQTRPYIEGEPDAIYAWDYRRFKRYMEGLAVDFD